ncbi:hypothetical protein [Actinomadura livida]|uniref:Uncharacterized protein n=1 Tax=Actinomadura livida TaxID=79909 RepID=A0A7W7MXA2_9ACTN|nr:MULTISPECIES: hypothetical protein [Actinomadura]MBB4774458.1 hypothetical protein [Actinomadura catellatispora]GGT82395.1 hypothetical protein GCM10010208_00860 [Actinomadura livida]
MPITDNQIATLRAQLAGRMDEHERLLDQLDTEESQTGYIALVTAAFFEAVDRRFIVNDKVVDDAEVIEFIAYQRSAHPVAAEQMDPTVAEQVVLHALGKGSISQDVDGETLLGTKILLLAALTAEADLSESELESFLAKARAEADEHIG